MNRESEAGSSSPQAPQKKTISAVVLLVGAFAAAALLVVWAAQRGGLFTSRRVAPAGGVHATLGAARRLVSSLSEFDLTRNAVTPEDAARFKHILHQLVEQGGPGALAIGEFLSRNIDLDFDPARCGDLLGYPSLRLALFDALHQIKGRADGVGLEVLRTTADPREIVVLSRNLQQSAPGKYRAQIIAAAREELAQAAKGELEGYDVGPLFQLFQDYGGSEVAADLEKAAAQWNFYSCIALGGLPRGAGIPSLMRLAQSTSIASATALRMLAQMAFEYPQAKEFLIQSIRSNDVPHLAWKEIGAALAGERLEFASGFGPIPEPAPGKGTHAFHIRLGNQNYRTVSASENWNEPQLEAHLALLDQIVTANTNLDALPFLRESRLLLADRQNR